MASFIEEFEKTSIFDSKYTSFGVERIEENSKVRRH